MEILFILNAPPYGSEHTYNGLRLAGKLARRDGHRLRVFLMGDAVTAAKAGQEVPEGFYNVERMLRIAGSRDGDIGVCGTCLDARGLDDGELADGARRSSMEELADWVEDAERILVF